jgi:hypothetical protein
MTTDVSPWFGRGTSNLARECDPPASGIGLTPEVGGRSSRPNHALACVATPRTAGSRW